MSQAASAPGGMSPEAERLHAFLRFSAPFGPIGLALEIGFWWFWPTPRSRSSAGLRREVAPRIGSRGVMRSGGCSCARLVVHNQHRAGTQLRLRGRVRGGLGETGGRLRLRAPRLE